MQIKFKFYGAIRGAVYDREVVASLTEGATMRDALDWLKERYGDRFARLVLNEKGEPLRHVSLFVGDREWDVVQLDKSLPNGNDQTSEISIYLLTGAMGG